ncbi:MAG: DUF2398 family protein [Victivallaceae bacterium]|nr:DUF2398 family protein [Victivallaceae bacterium]
MSENIDKLKEKYPEQVKKVLNLLLETAYFYRSDNEDMFLFLRRYQQEFRDFFRTYFDWELIMDNKCARVYKSSWFNEAVKNTDRMQFRLGGRDECIAFMLLIEFYEKLLEDDSMTTEDNRNPRFRIGELLEFQQRRFAELFPDEQAKYTDEYLLKTVLKRLMPQLLRYRFLAEVPRPQGMRLAREQFIYEAMPALYHYNTGRLAAPVGETVQFDEADSETDGDDEPEEDFPEENNE